MPLEELPIILMKPVEPRVCGRETHREPASGMVNGIIMLEIITSCASRKLTGKHIILMLMVM